MCLNNIFACYVIFKHPHGERFNFAITADSLLYVQHVKFAMHDFIKYVNNKGN